MSEVEWLEIFSANLVDALKDANMTQRELADDCGLSESIISDYVHGKKIPGLKAIINISYSLDCTIDELIDFGARII